MEPTPPPFSYAPPVRPANQGVFGTKIPSAVAFTIGILLFLLPFAQVKCNGSVLAQNSGLGIAMGSEWKEAGQGGMFGNMGNTTTTKPEKEKQKGPNMYAIAALGLGILGLLLSFAGAKAGGMGGLVTGLLSAAALIGMMINLKNSSELKMPDPGTTKPDGIPGMDSLNSMKVTMEFTPWYYIAVIAFVAAAVFCYKRMQSSKS